MGPIIDGLADISVGEIKVGKLDVDENPEVSRKYDIMSIPALLMFKDGKMVDTIVGLDPTLTPEVLKKYMLEL
jgi:thioredoxin 1